MKFKELKEVINRHPGRHDKIAITIGLGNDAIIEAESPILDFLDDYEVAWIALRPWGVTSSPTVKSRVLMCI